MFHMEKRSRNTLIIITIIIITQHGIKAWEYSKVRQNVVNRGGPDGCLRIQKGLAASVCVYVQRSLTACMAVSTVKRGNCWYRAARQLVWLWSLCSSTACMAVGTVQLDSLYGCGHCAARQLVWLWSLCSSTACMAVGTVQLDSLYGCGHCAA